MDLVVGATGHLGSAITRGLLALGRDVRILVRPGRDASALVSLGATAVEGDLKDPASLERACRGIDVVVTTANSAQRGGDDNPDTVEHVGNRALVDAAAAAGVKQFVFVSALGATENSPVPFMSGKASTEAALQRSGVPWTIIAPNIFIEVWVPMLVGAAVEDGRPVVLVGSGARRHSMVSARDVASFTINAIGNPAAMNRYLPLGGPEALSWVEVAERYGRARGKRSDVQFVSAGASIPGLPPAVAGLAAGMDGYDSVVPMDELWSTFDVRPTRLEDALGLTLDLPVARD